MSLADTLRYLQELPPGRRQPCLEAALQEDHPGVQTATVRWLLQSGPQRRPDLVVDHFVGLPAALQQELVAHRDELLAVAREKIVGGRDPRRLAAFRLVAAFGDLGSADLLVLGIPDPNDAVAEVALDGLMVRLRSYAQSRREALADGAPVARDARQEAAWQALATALRSCPDSRAEALCAVLFEFGVVSMSLFRGVLLAKPDSTICRAFGRLLGSGPAQASAQFVVQLALDSDPGLQRIGQQVLRDRRDEPFGREVAREIAAVRDDRSLALVRNLRDVPWWGPVQYVIAALELDVARRLIAVLAELKAEPGKRQGHLEAFLANPDGDVQAAAVRALHVLGCPNGIEAVAKLLRTGAVAGQRAAARLVIELVPSQRVALLTPLLGCSDPELRQMAVREVSKISFARYLERFDAMDEATRAIAAKALAKIDNQMLDRLADEIGALDPARRLKALRIVDVIDAGQELREPLLDLLDDPDRRVRATAIRIVELSGSYEGTKILLAALADPDRRVRANAVEAFEELADPRFVQILVPLLRDSDNRVRANAAKALWQLGWPEARDVMLAMLQDRDETTRLSAVWAIGEAQFAGARALLEAREAIEPAGRVRAKLREVLAAWPAGVEVQP